MQGPSGNSENQYIWMLLIAGIFYVGMQVLGGVKSEQAQKFKKLQKEMQGSLQAESSTLGVDSDDSSATSDDDLDAFQASIKGMGKKSTADGRTEAESTKTNTVNNADVKQHSRESLNNIN
jgi:hypothetical protein